MSLRSHKTRSLIAAVLLLGGLAPFGGSPQAAPGDLVFERKSQGAPEGAVEGAEAFPPSIFPHWVHRIRYRCYACHETLFKMKRGANAVTMKSINEGQFCGACHNGAVAFTPSFGNCTRCHREPED